MSIDAISSSRRYEPSTDDEPAPPPKATSTRPEALQAAHIESYHQPQLYPAELFAGSTHDKKPGVFARALNEPTATKHASDYGHVVREEHVKPAPDLTPTADAGRVYSTSPNELPVVRTKVATPDMVALVRKHWPDLTETGARTLASQWAAETGFGNSCWSNNFGNMKAFDTQQGHMYPTKVWEIPTSEAQAKAWRAAGGADASPAFKLSKGMPESTPMILFQPPNAQCRFKAFKTADDGMAAWVSTKQSIAAKQPGYVDALNRGDIKTVAHLLARAHYATMPEAPYGAAMERAQKQINASSGPVS